MRHSLPFILTIARLTALEAVRTRVPWLILAALVFAVILSAFLDRIAIIEAMEIRATIPAAVLRLTSVFIVIAFIASSMARESSDKLHELLLAQPVPRWAYFAGKWAGYQMVAASIALVFGACLALITSQPGWAQWSFSLLCELVIMASVTLFFALSFSQILAAMAGATALYLLARSQEAVQLIAHGPHGGDDGLSDRLITMAIDGVALLLPSLDRMTESAWIMHPPDGAVLVRVAVQTAIFAALIAAASLFDLYRRND